MYFRMPFMIGNVRFLLLIRHTLNRNIAVDIQLFENSHLLPPSGRYSPGRMTFKNHELLIIKEFVN